MQYRQDSGNARCYELGEDAGKALTCKVGLIRGTKNCRQTAYDRGEADLQQIWNGSGRQ
jgi:hypothetical protein